MKHIQTKQRQHILIIGAGELGMAMIKAFVGSRKTHPDIQLSVLLRPAAGHSSQPAHLQRDKQLAEWGIEVVTADLSRDDETSLAQLFKRFNAVINCSGFAGGAGTQLRISQAVISAGVDRYFPWQFGVDYDRIGMGSGQPVWDEQLQVRQLLRQQSATAWVIISTGMFISFLFEPDFGVIEIENQKLFALGAADYALTLTTAEDIGRLTADIFFYQPAIKNDIIYTAGDTVTYKQLTQLLSEHFSRPFTLEVRSHEQLQRRRSLQGDVASAYQLAFARESGIAWPKSKSWNARRGIEVTDVKRWLQENRSLNLA